MSDHPLGYKLFGDKFSTPEMRAIFTEASYIQALLDVEGALATAQGRLGVIPAGAAATIAAAARVERMDLDAIAADSRNRAHYLVAVVRALEQASGGEAGQYVHYGTTTQDIIDTATVLLLRRALGPMARDLGRVEAALAGLAERYKATPMAGRTHAVHALPITFGLKAAVWLAEAARHRQRLEQLKARLLVGNITGAVGTFAGFGPQGFAVQAETLRALGLGVPEICWHAARDRFAEFVSWEALTASSLAKIANEVRSLMKTEVGELEEPVPPGAVGSSTMPQKRNPNLCEDTLDLAKIVRGHAHAMLEAVEVEHERDAGAWRMEFVVLPESCLLFSAALRNAARILEGLVVHEDRMARNLDLTGGLIMAEAVMFALGEHIGKQRAHDVVYECAMTAQQSGRPFAEVLAADRTVGQHLTGDEIARLLDPRAHLGLSVEAVEQVLKGRKA